MAVTADHVIVELEAKLDKYNARISGAESHFDASMKRMGGSARRMEAVTSLAFKGAAAAIGAIGLVALGKQAVQTALDFRRIELAMAVSAGSAEAAGAEFAFLRDVAERLGLRFITLAESYTSLSAAARGTNLEGERTRDIFEAVTTAVVATGGSVQQAEGALLAIEQMISKGNVSAEELRGQLGERLPGAFQIAARAMNITTAELSKLLEKGDLAASDFLPRFADQLQRELPTSVQTADAAFQRFQTALDDIANSTADGFMSELYEATDDLTQILKDMESSGALEAFGDFLGDIVRLGGAAVQTLGGLIQKANQLQKSQLFYDIEYTQARNQQRFGVTQGIRQQGTDRLLALQFGTLDEFMSRAEPPEPPVVAGGGGGGGSGTGGDTKTDAQRKREAREAERRRVDALRREFEIKEEQLRADADILRANMGSVDNAETRAFLETQILDIQRIRERLENELAVKLGERTQAEADALEKKQEERAALERTALLEEERARKAEETFRLEDSRIRLGMELLGYEADNARTAAQRRAIELRILDLAFERERLELERLRDEAKSDTERQSAQEALDSLGARKAGARRGVMQRTQGPLEAYLDSLPKSAEEVNEAMEGVAANGLQSLTDGITDAIMGAKSLGDVFRNVANQIIADLIRIAVQKVVVNAIGSAIGLPGFAGGGSISVGGSGLPGFASGGSLFVRGNGGTDRNLLSINGKPVARVNQGERIDIVPQGKAISPISGPVTSRGVGAQPVAKVQLQLSGDLDAKIVEVAGPVAVEVVRASAPAIVGRAKVETIGELHRPRL